MKSKLIQRALLASLYVLPFSVSAQVQGEKVLFPLTESFVFVCVAGSLFVIAGAILVFAKNMVYFVRLSAEKSQVNKSKNYARAYCDKHIVAANFFSGKFNPVIFFIRNKLVHHR